MSAPVIVTGLAVAYFGHTFMVWLSIRRARKTRGKQSSNGSTKSSEGA